MKKTIRKKTAAILTALLFCACLCTPVSAGNSFDSNSQQTRYLRATEFIMAVFTNTISVNGQLQRNPDRDSVIDRSISASYKGGDILIQGGSAIAASSVVIQDILSDMYFIEVTYNDLTDSWNYKDNVVVVFDDNDLIEDAYYDYTPGNVDPDDYYYRRHQAIYTVMAIFECNRPNETRFQMLEWYEKTINGNCTFTTADFQDHTVLIQGTPIYAKKAVVTRTEDRFMYLRIDEAESIEPYGDIEGREVMVEFNDQNQIVEVSYV